MAEIWLRKYSPKKLSEVIGQDKAVSKLKRLVADYDKKNKGIFLYGGKGNGKTSSVYALAEQEDYELIELNASDTRNKDAIERIVGGASKQMSLFGNKKLILVDEIEGISGMKDRGGIQAVSKIIDSSSFPVIVIGYDAYDQKAKPLKKSCDLIEYEELSYESIFEILKKILDEEKISYDESALKQLARISGGDARAAINDLQTIAAGTEKVTKESIKDVGERKSTQSIETALHTVFKTTNYEVALGAFDDVSEDLDKIFLWVEENLPKEYLEPKALSNAFDNLSIADVFFGRIRRWQYYRFYVYCYQLLSAGIALSKNEKNSSQVKYKQNSRLLKIWISNNANAKRKSIAQKVAEKTHCSQKEAFTDTVPFLKGIFKNNKEKADAISDALDLAEEEIEWLVKK